MTAVSVALATFNGAPFLSEQLASLAAQTRLPDELVVTDDGSSDETVAIINGFAQTAPFPVRLQSNPRRLGYRGNFMHCTTQCKGQIIFFCDQDDVWEAGKIATMLRAFADSTVMAAFHDFVLLDPDGKVGTSPWKKTGERHLFTRGDFGSAWDAAPGFTLAIRRDLLAFNDLWERSIHPDQNERMSHDHWFCFLARNMSGLRFEAIELACYRQHAANTVGWHRARTGLFRRAMTRILGSLAWRQDVWRAGQARAAILQEISTRSSLDPSTQADLDCRIRALIHEAEVWRDVDRIADGSTLSVRLQRLWQCISRGHYVSGNPDLPGKHAIAGDLLTAIFGRARLRALQSDY